MILTLLPIISLVLFIVIMIYDARHCFNWEPFPAIGMVISLMVTLLTIGIMASGPACTRSEIKEFEAERTSIIQQRQRGVGDFEKAAITKQIIQNNHWLANEQYWAKDPWLNWFYDKDILNVKPIE